MFGRAFGLGIITALCLGAFAVACMPGGSSASGSLHARGANARAAKTALGGDQAAPSTPTLLAGGARYFQVIPEESFWVTHDAKLDRVVVAGARLETSPEGELLRTAWEPDEATKGDALQGSLAVAAHLGGGFLHWTGSRVFRSAEFTGPLEAVSLGRAPGGAEAQIRGARNGLRGVVLITEGGPLEVLPGSLRATAASQVALADIAAVDGSRALRLDVFGRAAMTVDGGKSWLDAAPFAGLSARSIAAGPGDLWLDTWLGRIKIGADGKGGEPDMTFRGMDYGKPFQLVFQGTRATDREGMPWVFRDSSPLQAAVFGGVTLPDGSALAVAHGGVARVDLATGKARAMATDWLPQGLECLPVSVDDGALFVCGWETYQGYGGYVLRSSGGEPPVVEKAFSEDGYFVSDDHGAVGYVGSCAAKPRLIDPEERGRDSGDIVPRPVICVRRGPGEWAELRVDLDAQTSLLGWIPSKDGTAVAMVLGTDVDQLPEPLDRKTRWSNQGSVRVLRLYQELPGWRWSRPSWRPYSYGRGAPSMFIEKRFRVRSASVVEGWISMAETFDMVDRTKAGVSIGLDGIPVVHPLPPLPSTVTATGDFGITITQEGELFETVDHGRSWRAAGRSPVAPTQMPGGCSKIGCSLSSVMRVGWGASRVAASMAEERPDDPEGQGPRLPKLVCEPIGAPLNLPGGAPSSSAPSRGSGANAHAVVSTGYGDTLEIIREGEPPEDPSAAPAGTPPMFGLPGAPPPVPTATPQASPPPSPGKKGPRSASTPAPLRTHTLVFRPPFDPDGPVRRLNATNAAFGYRRPPAIPLLGAAGDVSLLVFPDGGELLVTPSEVLNLPAYDTRRYSFGEGAVMAGLRTGRDRALILGDSRRRTSLEEHGPAPQPPPLYVAAPRDELRKRALSLARRDDGATGILVLDGAAPETAGVAALDRVGTTLSPVMKLAPWSTLTPAGDARCKADKQAWSALVMVEPRAWFALDARALPGVSLGAQGIVLVRWGRERVCLQALDLAATDARRRMEPGTSSLVLREAGASWRSALRWQDMKQELRCSLEAAGPGEP